MLKTLQQVVAYYEAQLKNVKPSDLARVTALLVGIGAFFGGILAMLILRVFVIYSVNYFLPYLAQCTAKTNVICEPCADQRRKDGR